MRLHAISMDSIFSVGSLGGYKGSWFDLAGRRNEIAFAEASKPGGWFEQAGRRNALAFAEASKPGGWFEQAGKRNAIAFAEASKPGGWFEQAGRRNAIAFAEASKPGGWFEQAGKRNAIAFAQASSRPKVKGVKKDGTQDKRCNPRTLKVAAARFDCHITEAQMRAIPGALGKRYYSTVSAGRPILKKDGTQDMRCKGSSHCFMPEALFKVKALADTREMSYLRANQLQKGSAVLAADGTTIEVLSIKTQIAPSTIVLRIGSITDIYTPCHRVMVPSPPGKGSFESKRAEELTTGDLVLCSCAAGTEVKALTGVQIVNEEKETFEIVFRPDKPVATFLPPNEMILTKGVKPKNKGPVRRGGASKRKEVALDICPFSGPDESELADAAGLSDDQMSIPDTDGEYSD